MFTFPLVSSIFIFKCLIIYISWFPLQNGNPVTNAEWTTKVYFTVQVGLTFNYHISRLLYVPLLTFDVLMYNCTCIYCGYVILFARTWSNNTNAAQRKQESVVWQTQRLRTVTLLTASYNRRFLNRFLECVAHWGANNNIWKRRIYDIFRVKLYESMEEVLQLTV